MARNDRIFYACQAVIVNPHTFAVANKNVIRGLQSVGMSANFTLDQVFEIGQLAIYENIEDVADIEVTLEKVIDGYAFIWERATDDGTNNALCRSSLSGAAKTKCDVYLAVYDDGSDNATGTPRNVCMNSGMYVSSVSYSYSVDGNATESVTLVGNDRFWNNDSLDNDAANDSAWEVFGTSDRTPVFDGADFPRSGVVRRPQVNLTSSSLPSIVESQLGDNAVGQGGAYHIQSINISADFGQENINELGRFGPYAKYATFPVEVSCEFEVIATSGDLQSVSGSGPNLTDNQIKIIDDANSEIDLGLKNKLSSVSYSGGDTGGGNATVTYAFSNFNDLQVTSNVDLSAQL